jgi:hypothetical protein
VLEADTLEVNQESPVLLRHNAKEQKSLSVKSANKKIKPLLLDSSHGRGIGSTLQENLCNKDEIVSIFKPNAPLANVAEDLDLGKLSKDLTKQDHTVTVGGPGNSLDRNYHYSADMHLKFIAKRTNNTNVGFVKQFMRHNKRWMKRRIRRMNVQLDWDLMEHHTSHTGIFDTASIMTKDYISHGLQLNSQGKRRLVDLTAEEMGDNHVTGGNSIAVITNDTASPFLV